MEELIKIIILGIVEGITEFLPISSTGHLVVFSNLLNSEMARLGGTFEIFIQLGAVVAVVIYYFGDIRKQVVTVHKDPMVQRLWLNIIIASVPAAILGFLARDFIKDTLFTPLVIAIALIVGGIIFILVERNPKPTEPDQTLDSITLKQAGIIGIFQAIAVIPGVSRSGASIIGGLLNGINRDIITKFSFYLAIPILGGATIIDLILSLDELQGNDLIYLIVGAIVSGIVAWLAIRWLIAYVSKNSFMIFGYYRIIAGIIILILLGINVL
ncbi:MAG: undecaprenyl-diphosphate phosphatase [bacterium]|nr:undecaprenyl-diphosphate phosphatase [bacterium]